MISQGRFEHIGRASIRLENATAWGVWFRVAQWSSALGNRPRLRCGALYHMANRTVTFHGVARQRGFWFHCLRVGLLRPSHNCLQFDESVLVWSLQLNLFFKVTSRAIQWQVR